MPSKEASCNVDVLCGERSTKSRQLLPPSLFLASAGNKLCNEFNDSFFGTPQHLKMVAATPVWSRHRWLLIRSGILSWSDEQAKLRGRITVWSFLHKLSPTTLNAKTEARSETSGGGAPKPRRRNQIAGTSRSISTIMGSLREL